MLIVSSQSIAHWDKASSLLLQITSSQSSHSVPTCSGKLSSSGKLFLVRDSSPGSFKTKPICLGKAPAPPARCLCLFSRLEFPAPRSCPAFQSHSSVLTALPKCPWKRSLRSWSPTASPWRSHGLVHTWKIIWTKGWCELKAEWESRNISGQKKPQVMKAVDGRVFKVSVFLHSHEWAWHRSAKWETSKSSIIRIVRFSSSSLPHFKKQEFWVLLAVINCFELLALKKGKIVWKNHDQRNLFNIRKY